MGTFKVNNWGVVTCIQEARGHLGEENFKNLLNEYRFIYYLSDLNNFPIQSPTLHWLLGRGEVETNNNPNKCTLKSTIGGLSYTFGHLEFMLITGLPFWEFPNCDEEAETAFGYSLAHVICDFQI
ncbi:hypothetical protein LIER_06605 [Lithospermum erythrorhizon]|uniref:Uncharacterized protein n=1 Tax=Lithospermum erythrorhizon TaxID=34254 RepID=A0AAV3P6H9_LITER